MGKKNSVVLPEEVLPVTLKLDPELRLSDDEYYKLCLANPDLRLEQTFAIASFNG